MRKYVEKSPKLEKWLRQMETIKIEISHLLGDVEAFRRLRQIVNSNPCIQKPHRFYRYIYDSYLSHVLMGLRRQVKSDRYSISLVGLLKGIANDPQELSRSYYRSLSHQPDAPDFREIELEGQAQLANLDITTSSQIGQIFPIEDDFVKHADASKTHVCPEMVRRDLRNLQTTVEACEDYADRRIAHRDKRNPQYVQTFEDLEMKLDLALEILQQMYEKYYRLFYAVSITVKPQDQSDWKDIFSVPWINTN